ncbi:MAG: TatD family hydrolase [Crocinitomicaceae bacterium]|nr:TatD family hydrolase [Crocinitomicaceae bacterium]
MEWIDTHCHLYHSQFDADREAMVERAIAGGIRTMLLPNISEETIDPMLALCDHFPTNCFPMLGLHPCDVKGDYDEVLQRMEQIFLQHRFFGVGETGIDLHWDKSTLALQIESFRTHIQWAKRMHLPLIIHARESFNEIFSVLDEMNDDHLKGIFHCFTGTEAQAKKIIEYGGFMLGIGGVLTYEKSGLDSVVKHLPLEYLVLETDAPFLAPKPFRGKRNESGYLIYIADRLSGAMNISPEEIAGVTTDNARRIFSL